jgi:hypothetical protein
VTAYIAERMAVASTDHTEIDFSGTSWEFIFQDIVRRSSTLRYVTAVTSFTCSKMRPEGFGGMPVLITADAIVGKSTNNILEDSLGENEGDAANDGVHVLFRIREDAVRQQSDQAIEADPRSLVFWPTQSMTPTSTPPSRRRRMQRPAGGARRRRISRRARGDPRSRATARSGRLIIGIFQIHARRRAPRARRLYPQSKGGGHGLALHDIHQGPL